MSVLALISDLMMQSQVSGAAQRAGVELSIAQTEDALVAKAEAAEPRLIIVDLSHPGVNPATLMDRLRPKLSEGTSTLAFGPHVHKGLLDAASQAGFATVLTRGQFHANMLMILSSVKSS